MQNFDAVLEVASLLNGPDGCPWDREQTFDSLRPYVLEEAHELLEAVDLGDTENIIEELGDLLYTVIFYTKIAEKEKRFSLAQVLDQLREKLVRRHPHVFSSQKATSIAEVYKHWEAVKGIENKSKGRKSAADGIPRSLPALFRAQKMLKRFKNRDFSFFPSKKQPVTKEEELTEELMGLIDRANEVGVDLESGLNARLILEEVSFRQFEENRPLA